jgi:hypothetical protein
MDGFEHVVNGFMLKLHLLLKCGPFVILFESCDEMFNICEYIVLRMQEIEKKKKKIPSFELGKFSKNSQLYRRPVTITLPTADRRQRHFCAKKIKKFFADGIFKNRRQKNKKNLCRRPPVSRRQRQPSP